MIAPALCLTLALSYPCDGPAQPDCESYRHKSDAATAWILGGATAAVIGWDLYLALRHQKTESQHIRDWAWDSNLLPFAAGTVLGHWFLNRKPDEHGGGPRNSPWIVAGSLGAVAAWDVAWALSRGQRHSWIRHPAIWAGLGIANGGLFWAASW